jgi:hypothetical protein
LCLVSRLEGVCCVGREAIRTTTKDGEKRRTKKYQQQHVTAGAPMRKSVPTHSLRRIEILDSR